jgi:hypothetical protein
MMILTANSALEAPHYLPILLSATAINYLFCSLANKTSAGRKAHPVMRRLHFRV